jgi:ABC-type uncharacterized transport system substrate-binding protein
MTLEQLKKQADFIELKLQIYGDQFGPSSDVAEQLKKELKKANMMILELMVQDQTERLNKATIE